MTGNSDPFERVLRSVISAIEMMEQIARGGPLQVDDNRLDQARESYEIGRAALAVLGLVGEPTRELKEAVATLGREIEAFKLRVTDPGGAGPNS